jgi:undecaprenyl diphosphate synthase
MFKKKVQNDGVNIPQHIAFIMDGNGRWAKQRLLPRNMGHRAGVRVVQNVVDYALELKLKYITFYAFSTENWKRPEEEVSALLDIFREFLSSGLKRYKDKDIKLNILGDISRFPRDIQEAIRDALKNTADGKTLTVNIAFNYGGKDEILRAVKLIKDSNEEITEENFRKYLYTRDIPDPDIIVRTSGEMRLSNFLLFQSAYSELYFMTKFWPDFDYNDLIDVINEYGKRNRRYGK